MSRYLHCCWISLLLISRNSSAPRRVDMPGLTTTYNLLPSSSTIYPGSYNLLSQSPPPRLCSWQARSSGNLERESKCGIQSSRIRTYVVLRNAHQPTRRQNIIQVTGQCALVGNACRCGRLIVIKGKGENHVSPSTMQALITQWNMSNQL